VPGLALLTARDLAKSFGTRAILRGVSLTVHDGDRIGLVGVNGSGKSTLMRLMLGRSADGGPAAPADGPDGGELAQKRGLRVEYVPQEPRLPPDRTVGEHLREGLALAAAAQDLDAGAMEFELRGLAAALELPPLEQVLGVLSQGERRRVALGRAILAAPELLALDEPTNHLDTRTVVWLEERLGQLPGALLLVTHDRYFLDRVANRIIELDRGHLHAYEGNYSRFLEKQAERLAIEARGEQGRQSFIRRELDWIRRGPAARTTKQQARIDRFDAAVSAAPGQDDKRQKTLELRLPVGPRLGKTILELHGVTKRITTPKGERTLFRGLDLIMKPGDRIGIVGDNGAGKSTLLKVMLGQLEPDAGRVVVGPNTKIAFLDQTRSALDDDDTVLQAVAGDNDHVILEDGPVHVRTFLRMMLFPDAAADTPVGTLSGGERNRVELARLLREGGNLIVLDEPTNDLDLVTLGVLEDALVDFPGCALIVSHDRWFLDKVATGILAFEGDGQVGFYEGDYSSWAARRKAAARPARETGDTRGQKPTRAPGPRKLTFKEKKELEGIEAAIAAAETRVTDLEAQLAAGDVYKTRAAEVPAMLAELDVARAEVERLFARWQELDAVAQAEPR
jgi:ATP-binding cassette subfamily F protein uup